MHARAYTLVNGVNAQNSISAGALPQIPLGELAYSAPPSSDAKMLKQKMRQKDSFTSFFYDKNTVTKQPVAN